MKNVRKWFRNRPKINSKPARPPPRAPRRRQKPPLGAPKDAPRGAKGGPRVPQRPPGPPPGRPKMAQNATSRSQSAPKTTPGAAQDASGAHFEVILAFPGPTFRTFRACFWPPFPFCSSTSVSPGDKKNLTNHTKKAKQTTTPTQPTGQH